MRLSRISSGSSGVKIVRRAVLPTIDSLSLSQRLRCPGRVSPDAGIPRPTALLFQSAEDARHLSHMRYKGGRYGHFEFLTNETNAFSAELGLMQA
jgi:hypothetical protein